MLNVRDIETTLGISSNTSLETAQYRVVLALLEEIRELRKELKNESDSTNRRGQSSSGSTPGPGLGVQSDTSRTKRSTKGSTSSSGAIEE